MNVFIIVIHMYLEIFKKVWINQFYASHKQYILPRIDKIHL